MKVGVSLSLALAFCSALGQGTSDVEAVRTALRTGTLEQRLRAIEVAAQSGEPQLSGDLISLYTDPEPRLRLPAVKAYDRLVAGCYEVFGRKWSGIDDEARHRAFDDLAAKLYPKIEGLPGPDVGADWTVRLMNAPVDNATGRAIVLELLGDGWKLNSDDFERIAEMEPDEMPRGGCGSYDHGPEQRLCYASRKWPDVFARLMGEPQADRQDLLRYVEEITSPALRRAVIATTTDKNPAARSAAIWLLSGLADEQAKAVVRAALQDPFARVRYAAMSGLAAHTGDKWSCLCNFASDQSESLRREIASDMVQADSKRSTVWALGTLKKTGRPERTTALSILGALVGDSAEAGTALISYASNPQNSDRYDAIRSLFWARSGNQKIKDFLYSLGEASDEDSLLTWIDYVQSDEIMLGLPRLKVLLQNGSSQVRKWAKTAFEELSMKARAGVSGG